MSPRLLDRLALGAAALSLLVLGLRPSSERMVDPTAVVVQTPGASNAEAQAVADSLGGAAIVDLEQRALPASATRLHVVGDGLSEGELRRVGQRSIVLHPRALPDGVREVDWSSSVTLGEEVEVRATVRTSRRATLTLLAETGPVDSVVLPAGTITVAALRHTPRALGSALYALRLGTRTDSFSVVVAAPAPPSLLILGSAPSREWSDLRDWAARQGGSVSLRTTVSRDRSRIERVNVPSGVATGIDGPTLDRTAVVVTDGRTLAGLPASERRALRTAVRGGLGLIVVLDDAARDPRRLSPADRAALLPWRTTSAGDLDERLVRPRTGGIAISPTPVSAEPVVLSGAPFGTIQLLDDGQGGVLAMTMSEGTGWLVGTVVTGPGRWLRGGEREGFAKYWSTLIRAAARPDPARSWWTTPGRPVLIDAAVQLEHRGAALGTAIAGGDTLHLAADPLVPGRSVARWWPRQAGWNDLDGARLWIGGRISWESWQKAERRRVTERWIDQHRTPAHEGERIPLRSPWPLWPFFLSFVAAAAWLWRVRA